MMLVPLGHERDVVRRWPVITVGIMGLCLLIHSWVYYEDRAVDRAFAAAAVELVQYAEDHPELQEPPGYAKIAWLVTPRRPSQARAPRYRASDTGDQATLDGLVAKAEATLLQHPYFRFGYVPERRNWLGLVTSAFIHGGYLHLIFNMWFLWLAGTSLEDRSACRELARVVPQRDAVGLREGPAREPDALPRRVVRPPSEREREEVLRTGAAEGPPLPRG